MSVIMWSGAAEIANFKILYPIPKFPGADTLEHDFSVFSTSSIVIGCRVLVFWLGVFRS